jgi:alpha-amylase
MLEGYLRLQRAMPANRWSPFLRNHDQTRTLTDLGGDRAKAKMAVTLLLTLPGVPFLYYGEEIGMSANKRDGDERLRTPMQWSSAPHGGFTTGTPWHPLRPDSATVTVAAQDRDPASLLNLHRRLIHLRAANPALAGGELVPLSAEQAQVVAYLRRDGHRAVLVIANLGTTPTAVALNSDTGALPAGPYRLRSLLEPATAARLVVTPDGRLRRYLPLPSLGPLQARVFELERVPR